MSDEFENVEMTEETEDLMVDDEFEDEETEAGGSVIGTLVGKAAVAAAGMAVGAVVTRFGRPVMAAAGAKVAQIRETRRSKKAARLKAKLDKLEGADEDPTAKKK